MRIVNLLGLSSVEIDAHESVGFALSPLTKGHDIAVATVRLDPGGRIGRHPAASRQILAVVQGTGVVSGHDGADQVLNAGSAAIWEEGEMHETRTTEGLVALVIEGSLEPG